MAERTTMTIHVTPDLKARLDRLAHDTRRSRSFLAAEAVSAYVDRELAIIDGIVEGMRDMEAGRLVEHEDAMVEIDAVIAAAEAKQA